MRTAANVLSVLLHPLWMPTLLLFGGFRLDPHLAYSFLPEGRLFMLAMVFAMTGLFPLMSALLMHRTGVVSALSMPDRGERILPFMVALLYYGMCYWLLRRTPVHPLVLSLFLGVAGAMALTLVITFRWKISAHMVGIGGLIGALFALVVEHGVAPWPVIGLLFVLAGALGTARLLVSDHSQAQIHAGALLGAVCVFTSAYLRLEL